MTISLSKLYYECPEETITYVGGHEFHYIDNGRGRIRCYINGRRVTQARYMRLLILYQQLNDDTRK